MARRKKPSGRMSSGPWTFEDFRRVFEAEGYQRVEGSSHPQWRHPQRPGKVCLDEKWTGVKYGHEVFASLGRQSGYGKKVLRRLMNDLPEGA
jgi:hypothetical protein